MITPVQLLFHANARSKAVQIPAIKEWGIIGANARAKCVCENENQSSDERQRLAALSNGKKNEL
jgi:hypothetical protein